MANTWGTSWGVSSAWGTSWGGAAVGPTVFYQGDGKRRRRKKRQFDRLMAELEATLRGEVYGYPIQAPTEVPHGTPPPVLDLSRGVDSALDQLLKLAGEYQDLSAQVARVKQDVKAYDLRQAYERELDDEDELLLML